MELGYGEFLVCYLGLLLCLFRLRYVRVNERLTEIEKSQEEVSNLYRASDSFMFLTIDS